MYIRALHLGSVCIRGSLATHIGTVDDSVYDVVVGPILAIHIINDLLAHLSGHFVAQRLGQTGSRREPCVAKDFAQALHT